MVNTSFLVSAASVPVITDTEPAPAESEPADPESEGASTSQEPDPAGTGRSIITII